MSKSNFFLTAVGLNLGLLAFSYWFSRDNNESKTNHETNGEDNSSSVDGQSGSQFESGNICAVCLEEIKNGPMGVLLCSHKVHGRCHDQMLKNSLPCPTCTKEGISG